jgi:hypothetical protein
MFYAMKAFQEKDYETAISLANSAYAQDLEDLLLAKFCETVVGASKAGLHGD